MTQTKAPNRKSELKLPARYPGHASAYRLMFLGRLIDNEAPNFLRKAMGWSYHAPNAGHDAIQLALGCTFRAGKDFFFPYYRDLTSCLAAGISAREIILNGLSRDADVAGGGRHMSNHFAKISIGVQNVSSCVSNHIQHAAGLGRAIKYYKSDAVVYCSFGESSSSEGYVYEGLNGISKEKLPVVTIMQDNGYGISVPKRDQSSNECLADNFAGIADTRIWKVDGRDTLACFMAMEEAAQFAREQRGCAIVYAWCVRIGSHSNSDNHILYRDEKELAEAKAKDPLPAFRRWLAEEAGLTEKDLAGIEEDARREFDDAKAFGEASPLPDPKSATEFVIPPSYEPTPAEIELPENTGELLTLRLGINAAMKREFRDNPDTFLWGQDIANKEKEGIFLVSKGMQPEFGIARVFNAPIAENYIMGTANGFSRFNEKIRVVVEGAEFADYFWPAMDQYVECGHEYYRTRGQFTPNVVIRLASGGFIGGGLYHSQSIEGSLANIPGVRIVYPSFADDAYGLMRTAMKSKGPTIFMEPKALYNAPSTRTKVPENLHVPFGKARLRREGSDVVVITYGNATHMALKAAEAAGSGVWGSGSGESSSQNPKPKTQNPVSVAVLDLRSLIPLDEEAILEHVKKCGRVVVAHEGPEFGGFGGEIVALIAKKAFEYLDAPVERVGAKLTPVPFSTILEKAILPQVDDILAAIGRVAGY
ncbi:2-oxoisovalerate dehydrogenase E1 component [Planctomycetaceae bacterium]|nr:2-oxoisovalerate dehydrogenase E1 component [Planctomycetaceae bacterium]